MVGADPQVFQSSNPKVMTVKKDRIPRLHLFNTPQTVRVKTRDWSYTFTVTNFGAAIAYNVTVLNILPPATLYVTSSSEKLDYFGVPKSQNANVTLDISSNREVHFFMEELEYFGKERVRIKVEAQLEPGSCALPPMRNYLLGKWGCGGRIQERVSLNDTSFVFLPGSVFLSQFQPTATLCGQTSYVAVQVINDGQSYLYNLIVAEHLNSYLAYVPNSTYVSVQQGPFKHTGDPIINGYNLTWTSSEMPALRHLVTADEKESDTSEVLIRFDVYGTEDLALDSDGNPPVVPAVYSFVSAETPCYDTVTRASDALPLELSTASLVASITFENLNDSGAPVDNTIYAGGGDVIESTIKLSPLSFKEPDLMSFDHVMIRVDLPSMSESTMLTLLSNHSSWPAPIGTVSGNWTLIPGIRLNDTNGVRVSYRFTLDSLSCDNDFSVVNVTWSCGSSPSLVGPVEVLTSAQRIVMDPYSTSSDGVVQNLTYANLENGNVEIQLAIQARGAPVEVVLTNISIPDDFFADLVNLTTVGSSTQNYTLVSHMENGVLVVETSPNLILRLNEKALFRISVAPSIDFPEVLATSYDVQSWVTLQDSCDAVPTVFVSNLTLPGVAPHLSITPPAFDVVCEAFQTVQWTITNEGLNDAYGSFHLASSASGANITAISVSNNGAPPVSCSVESMSCTLNQIGLILEGTSVSISVAVSFPSESSGTLIHLNGTVHGEYVNSAYMPIGTFHSLETVSYLPLVLGNSLSLISTSENFTSGTTLAIGETVTITSEIVTVSFPPSISELSVIFPETPGLHFLQWLQTDTTGTQQPPVASSANVSYSSLNQSNFETLSSFELITTTNASSPEIASVLIEVVINGTAYNYLDDSCLERQLTLHPVHPQAIIVKEVRGENDPWSKLIHVQGCQQVYFRLTAINTGSIETFNIDISKEFNDQYIKNASLVSVQGSSKVLPPSENLTYIYEATIDCFAPPLAVLQNSSNSKAEFVAYSINSTSPPAGVVTGVDSTEIVTLPVASSWLLVGDCSNLTLDPFQLVVGRQVSLLATSRFQTGYFRSVQLNVTHDAGLKLFPVGNLTSAGFSFDVPLLGTVYSHSDNTTTFSYQFEGSSGLQGANVSFPLVAQALNIPSNTNGATRRVTLTFFEQSQGYFTTDVAFRIVEPTLKTSLSFSNPSLSALSCINATLSIRNSRSNVTGFSVGVEFKVPLELYHESLTVNGLPHPVQRLDNRTLSVGYPNASQDSIHISPLTNSTFVLHFCLNQFTSPGSQLKVEASTVYASVPENGFHCEDLGARDTTFGSREYQQRTQAPLNVILASLTKSLFSTELPETLADQVAIGEGVVYRVEVVAPPGDYDNLKLVDEIPANTELLDFELVNNSGPLATFTLNQTTGSLTYIFGDVQLNDTTVFSLYVAARVPDSVLNSDGFAFDCNATLAWDDQQISSGVGTAIVEPLRNLIKSSSSSAGTSGDVVTYTIVWRPISSAPAWNVLLKDELEYTKVAYVAGSALVTPSVVTLDVRNNATFVVAAPYLNESATLRLSFDVIVLEDVLPGELITNQVNSTWLSHPNGTVARSYFLNASTEWVSSEPSCGVTLTSTSINETRARNVSIGERITHEVCAQMPRGDVDIDFIHCFEHGLNITNAMVSQEGAHLAFTAGALSTSPDGPSRSCGVYPLGTVSSSKQPTSDRTDLNVNDTLCVSFTTVVTDAVVNQHGVLREVTSGIRFDGTGYCNDTSTFTLTEPEFALEITTDNSTYCVGDVMNFSLLVSQVEERGPAYNLRVLYSAPPHLMLLQSTVMLNGGPVRTVLNSTGSSLAVQADLWENPDSSSQLTVSFGALLLSPQFLGEEIETSNFTLFYYSSPSADANTRTHLTYGTVSNLTAACLSPGLVNFNFTNSAASCYYKNEDLCFTAQLHFSPGTTRSVTFSVMFDSLEVVYVSSELLALGSNLTFESGVGLGDPGSLAVPGSVSWWFGDTEVETFVIKDQLVDLRVCLSSIESFPLNHTINATLHYGNEVATLSENIPVCPATSTPSPSPTPSSTPTTTASRTPSTTTTPTTTSTASATPTATATTTTTVTATPTVTTSPTMTASATVTPTITTTATATATITPTPTTTASATASATTTATTTLTATVSATTTATATLTTTATATPSVTASATSTATRTSTATSASTHTITASPTTTVTTTPTTTTTLTTTITASTTATATPTSTASPTVTPATTTTATTTSSATMTTSITATATASTTPTATASASPSTTPVPTVSTTMPISSMDIQINIVDGSTTEVCLEDHEVVLVLEGPDEGRVTTKGNCFTYLIEKAPGVSTSENTKEKSTADEKSTAHAQSTVKTNSDVSTQDEDSTKSEKSTQDEKSEKATKSEKSPKEKSTDDNTKSDKSSSKTKSKTKSRSTSDAKSQSSKDSSKSSSPSTSKSSSTRDRSPSSSSPSIKSRSSTSSKSSSPSSSTLQSPSFTKSSTVSTSKSKTRDSTTTDSKSTDDDCSEYEDALGAAVPRPPSECNYKTNVVVEACNSDGEDCEIVDVDITVIDCIDVPEKCLKELTTTKTRSSSTSRDTSTNSPSSPSSVSAGPSSFQHSSSFWALLGLHALVPVLFL